MKMKNKTGIVFLDELSIVDFNTQKILDNIQNQNEVPSDAVKELENLKKNLSKKGQEILDSYINQFKNVEDTTNEAFKNTEEHSKKKERSKPPRKTSSSRNKNR